MEAEDFKAWRKRLGLTQEAAGKLLGISRRAVIDRESGTAAIGIETERATVNLEHLVRETERNRDRMLADVARFREGDIRIGKTTAGGVQVDTTEQWIAELERRVAELDAILAEHRGRVAT